MAIYLNEDEVDHLIGMPTVLDAVEQVMAAHGRGETIDFPRQRVRLPATMTHLLQGGVPAVNLSGLKVYTSSGGRYRSWVHLFDATSGDPVAVLEANRLGMMRTGAAGASRQSGWRAPRRGLPAYSVRVGRRRGRFSRCARCGRSNG